MRMVFSFTGPYSPGWDPIEPDWAKHKKRIHIHSPDHKYFNRTKNKKISKLKGYLYKIN